LQVSGAPIVPYVSFMSGANWNGIQLKDVYSFANHSVTAGIDYSSAVKSSRSFNSDKSEKAPFYPNYELQSVAGYVQGQLNFLDRKLVVNPGVRYDMITYNVKQTPFLNTYAPGKESNPFFSPSLSAQYTFLDFTPHATIGRAFVTPDAYNVAGYSELIRNNAASVTVGNASLKNESSTSWDLGMRYYRPQLALNVDVTYFSTAVEDRITTQNTKITSGEKTESGYVIADRTTYINASKAEISGLEAAASIDVGQLLSKRYSFRIFADASRNFRTREVLFSAAGEQTYRPIFNVPNFTSNYGLEFGTRNAFTARLSGRYVGERKDNDFTDTKRPIIVYPSFMTVDFATSFTYDRKHTISLLAENLSDENYYEKRGFNLQGRNFSLRYALSF
jgi:vitamin B12 transporter